MKLWHPRLLTWKEPWEYLRDKEAAARARRRWWHRPAWAELTFAGLWTVSYPSRHFRRSDLGSVINHASPWAAALFWVGTAWCYVYLFPWLYRFVQPEVFWYQDFLLYRHGSGGRRTRYAQVASFTWQQHERYQVLTLVRRNGKTMTLGAPPGVDTGRVHEWLIRHDALPLPAEASAAGQREAFAGRGPGV